MRTGTANLPLHGGRAPRWLFKKMVELGREISIAVIDEYGPEEYLQRLADPYWFQALGCVLGYDWHSSGLTTVTGGALKVALKDLENDTGIFVCGGKGATSRKTPDEITSFSEKFQIKKSKYQNLIYSSKMSAKVDNTALQDGYQLYHHNFFFDLKGNWTVVQQGMNQTNGMARRYHWSGQNLEEFTVEPHTAICCNQRDEALNLTDKKSIENKNFSVELTTNAKTTWKNLKEVEELNLPRHHWVNSKEKYTTKYLEHILGELEEKKPRNFEEMLATQGVGPKTIRALSLVGELIYGKKPSYEDPARYSFAHGGKDGIPFPVEKKIYDQSIEILRKGINKAKIERSEKKQAFRRLGI
ncbi:MAG: DUF763 domain-containing protein [Patescibacteria group bacterium]|nr:DUF763 domain-containing protein [Patescibacteria group bacterium]